MERWKRGEKRKMPRRSYEDLEIMREKSSMSQKIVQNKDAAYGKYAGASFEIASTMAFIDAFTELGLIPEKDKKPIAEYRKVLDLQRKAFLASTSSEITMLGFLLGIQSEEINVTE